MPNWHTGGTPQAIICTPFLSFPATPSPSPASPPPQSQKLLPLFIPVREQVKLLLFEEGSLELSCGRGLDTPALPGDVRGSRRGASGCQAETVAAQRETTHHHQGPSQGAPGGLVLAPSLQPLEANGL